MELHILISVVVCTYNRCDDLQWVLQSLILQDYPVSDFEILVVDNNSKDSTKDVVSKFKQVRYILEEKIGLSHARNRGIKESRGAIIAFIDDDAGADKSWLSKLYKVYREEKDVGCVGGQVILDWHTDKPSWWLPELNTSLSGVDYAQERTRVSYPRYPYGTNISYKTDVLKVVGSFGTELGRKGSKLLAGEETELCLRMEKKGYKIFYEPEAIVFHRVESSRLTKSYIRKRAYWHGRSHALLELRHYGQAHVLENANRYFKIFCKWLAKMNYPLTEQKQHLFSLGYIVQSLLIRSKLA